MAIVVLSLIVVGALLLLLETVLPGLIAGIAGIACLIIGVALGYAHFGPDVGTWILVGVGAGLLAATAAYVKLFPNSRVAQRFVSKRTIGTIGAEKPELVHQTGVAHTNLRPSGTALINGHRVDVVTEGPMIERGTPVKVIAVEGLRVVVRAT
jgi:membrane-bound serine protease (ClpP class)